MGNKPGRAPRERREHPIEFKEAAARRLLAGESSTALSRELDVRRSVLYRWRDAYLAEGRAGLGRRGFRAAIYDVVEQVRAEGSLSVERACELGRVSRAGFYRRFLAVGGAAVEVELRDRIQRIALEHRRYGYRRITAELGRQGLTVNHKKVLRLMGEDNLLALTVRRFAITTDSDHFLPLYPNLAARLIVDNVDQLWQADITYIRLRESFIYLAVVLDACSRRIVGWRLGRTLEAELAAGALEQALAARRPAAGWVHHSDRGVQYASRAYVGLLESHGALISMSRRGNPYDNARAESFMKTLKSEEVHLQSYRDLDHARASIGEFLEEVYNRRRLHSALGYRPPEEFEAALAQPGAGAARNPRYEFSKA